MLLLAAGISTAFSPLASVEASPVNYELVTVGDAGNEGDTALNLLGVGGVAYEFMIGKYEVTIGQYVTFLNAVGATDEHGLYNVSMATNANIAGISRTGSPGSYQYNATGPFGVVAGQSTLSRPVTFVSWFDAARLANWMANGQPSGGQNAQTTEEGAYSLVGVGSDAAVQRNEVNPNTGLAPTFYLPNRSEWYKAAYFDPGLNSGAGGYWTYATQSNSAPGNNIGSGSNNANYVTNVPAVTQSGPYQSTQNYLTDVGAFGGSHSHYGAFDMTGNVWEWNDRVYNSIPDGGTDPDRYIQGGGWASMAVDSSSTYATPLATMEDYATGIRLAAPVTVPEPSTLLGVVVLVGYGGWRALRNAVSRSRLSRGNDVVSG